MVNSLDNDRRVGAHWAHINSGGPAGMTLIGIAPRTMPQPHSHPGEECWLMVEGETVLSLGKQIRRMTAGQAYKIPPTGITAHSNLNLGDEPVEMIFMGPAGGGGGGRGAGRTRRTWRPADLPPRADRPLKAGTSPGSITAPTTGPPSRTSTCSWAIGATHSRESCTAISISATC